MSSNYVVSNNSASLLANAVTSATQTTLTVTAGQGALFASPTGGNYTLVTLENAAGDIEIVSVVGRVTDTLTIGIAGTAGPNAAGRGQEGTTARTWAVGDLVECRATAAIVARGGNAATGNGTANGTNTGDQTTIAGITGTIAQFNTACTDANFATGGGTATGSNTGDNADTTGKSAKTDALNSATTVVNVASATAPTSGQVLTATSGTAATWQTPAAGFTMGKAIAAAIIFGG